MELELGGKVAVITGGSSGIGLAVADRLAGEGVHLALCARKETELDAAVRDLAARYPVRVVGVAADVSRGDEISRFADRVAGTFGRVDILINNAGIGSNETILDAPDSRWQYYWDLHVMAAVRLARIFVPIMKKGGGGVILHNASICASQPLGHEPIYNVTKAALVMFSKCLANEVAKDNIRVNAVNPGLVLTTPWREYAEDQAEKAGGRWENILDQIAAEKSRLSRFASPGEIADFFIFLCSPRAAYCTGSTYYIDGGWLRVVK
ncbi:MAG: SDR family oxidoreductase [Acidobacteria bacterium]|nr:MAG: SDR family oxidoreductase [Acidobacteriota bacterium]